MSFWKKSFLTFSRITKTEFCHIYNLEHIKHNTFVDVASKFSNI